jgi:hypothetical protein
MEWKKIEGYVNYECSNTGLIKTFNWKNTGKEKIMKPALDSNGYLRTVLKRNDGKLVTIKVHRIICETFKGKTIALCVNHINFNRTDNNIDNLEWLSIQDNNKHSLINNNLVNGQFVGEKHYKAVLTEADVIDIRNNYVLQKRGYRKEMALKFNVSEATIKDVISRKSWKHVV